MKTLARLTGLAMALASLALQASLTFPAARQNGMSSLGALLFFLSYFTILSNFAAAACFAGAVWPKGAAGRFFARPEVHGAVLSYILLVAIVYYLVLRPSLNPQGAWKLADHMLHYAVPAYFAVCWAGFADKGGLAWKLVPLWLVPPLIYLAYALIRGILTGLYPYGFLDLPVIGLVRLARNVAVLLALFAGLGAVIVALDKTLAGTAEKALGRARALE